MCFAVKYKGPTGKLEEVYAGKGAQVPVVNKAGEAQLVRWGRDKKELGNGFAHHCARIESIEAGKWSWLQPRAVSVDISEFADWGTDGQVHWHVVPGEQGVRGALIQDSDVLRVYVITEPVPLEVAKWSKGGRWPRVTS